MKSAIAAAAALILIAVVAGGFIYYTYYVPTTSGKIFYSITLNYTDGSSNTWDVSQAPWGKTIPSFTMAPDSLMYNGKQLSGVTFNLYVEFNSTKQISEWQMVGTQHMEVYLGNAQTPATSSTGQVNGNGGSVQNGDKVLLLSTPLTSDQIEQALVPNGGAGSWYLNVVASINVAVTFSDGQVKDVYDLAPVCGLAFNFDGTLSLIGNGAALNLSP